MEYIVKSVGFEEMCARSHVRRGCVTVHFGLLTFGPNILSNFAPNFLENQLLGLQLCADS